MEIQIIRRRIRGGGGGGGVFLLSELPESLLLEILYRLPIKSVFKFKSVSKSWLSLISDPLFARSYCSRRITIIQSSSSTNNPPWTILYRYDSEIHLSPEDMWLHVLKRRHSIFKLPSFTLRFLSDTRDDGKVPNIVLAVSNGLLLSTAKRTRHDCYYISNPFTKQWSALPKPLRIHKWVSVGFIVEPIDGSFQVVRIGGYQGSSNVVNFEIFSSKTRQWKDKSASFNLPVHLFLSRQMYTYCHAVPCKKILHWMEYDGRIIAYDTSQTDTENDDKIRCRVIDLPGDRINKDKVTAGTIGVCQDHLRYCHVANWSQIENVRVWELRKSNNEGEGDWFLLYRMRLDGINGINIYQMVLPIAFHPLDPDIVYLIRRRRRILTNLNLRTRVSRDLIPMKGVVHCSTVFAFVLPPWPTPIPQISLTPLDLQ